MRTLRILPKTFAALRSDADAMQLQAGIENRPNAWLYQRDKLALMPVTGEAAFTHGEEVYRSNWASYIPGVKASNRLFTVTLNRIRADAYDAMVAEYGAEGGPPAINGRLIADFVNTTTGRGEVKGLEKTVTALNGVMWAPRLRLSRLMLATGQPLLRRQPWRVRKAVAKEYARYILGSYIAGQLLSLVWGEPEDDPRSAYFKKWQVPGTNTYVSPFQGLASAQVLLTRLWTGKKKTRSGDIVAIRGPNVPYGGDTGLDVVVQWLRGGLAPGSGALVDIGLTGTDFKGDPVTILGALVDSMTPMFPKTVYETMMDRDVPRATAVNALAFFGASVQTEERQEEHNSGRRERSSRKRSIRRRLPE
ncbi:MAG: hypothetical protein LLG01_12240 [Planctomycetaceae bacterium]|nr:hypothetical protein [Planctomycetaceae bacterium]